MAATAARARLAAAGLAAAAAATAAVEAPRGGGSSTGRRLPWRASCGMTTREPPRPAQSAFVQDTPPRRKAA